MKYKKIISWSDNRFSDGNVYKKTGFRKTAELAQDYSYVYYKAPKKRESKQSFKKGLIKCRENQTERERALELGYSRIWDCGKIRWEMEI